MEACTGIDAVTGATIEDLCGNRWQKALTRETWHAEGDSRGSGPLKSPSGRSRELLHGPGNIKALANGNNVLSPARHPLCGSVEWERIP